MDKRLTELVGLHRYLWTKDQIAERLAYIREKAEQEYQEQLEVDPGYTVAKYCQDMDTTIAPLADLCWLLGLSLEQEARVTGERGMITIWGVAPGEPLLTAEVLAKQQELSTWLRGEFEIHRCASLVDQGVTALGS